MRISDWSSDVCSSDLIMVDVGIHARLLEGIQRRTGRATAYEPGLQVLLRRVGKFARFPYPVAVTSDKVRTRIAIGLRMDHQHGFTHLGFHGALAGQCANLAVEHHVRGRKRAHHFRSEEHTSELQSLMRISYAVFCLKKKKQYKY